MQSTFEGVPVREATLPVGGAAQMGVDGRLVVAGSDQNTVAYHRSSSASGAGVAFAHQASVTVRAESANCGWMPAEIAREAESAPA